MRTSTLRRSAAALATLAALATPPAAAGYRLEKRLALEPGGRFVLNAEGGSVRITGSTERGAEIIVTARRDDVEEVFDLRFEEEPGLVRVEAKRRRRGFGELFRWSDGLRFEVRVPRSTQIQIDTSGGSIEAADLEGPAVLDTSGGSIRAERLAGGLIADTSGGSIEVEDIGGDARLDTSGGSIRARGVRGDLTADTSGGSIELEEVAGDIEADTSGGSIRIRGAGSRVEAHTSGGPVAVDFAPGNASGGSLSSSGGGVTVRLDPAARLEIDAAASGGSVRSDLPVTVRGAMGRTSLRGTLNGGGPLLRLRSSGGGIRITAEE